VYVYSSSSTGSFVWSTGQIVAFDADRHVELFVDEDIRDMETQVLIGRGCTTRMRIQTRPSTLALRKNVTWVLVPSGSHFRSSSAFSISRRATFSRPSSVMGYRLSRLALSLSGATRTVT